MHLGQEIVGVACYIMLVQNNLLSLQFAQYQHCMKQQRSFNCSAYQLTYSKTIHSRHNLLHGTSIGWRKIGTLDAFLSFDINSSAISPLQF